jgi:hypothetical protein
MAHSSNSYRSKTYTYKKANPLLWGFALLDPLYGEGILPANRKAGEVLPTVKPYFHFIPSARDIQDPLIPVNAAWDPRGGSHFRKPEGRAIVLSYPIPVLQLIVIYFIPWGETNDRLLPASTRGTSPLHRRYFPGNSR